MGPLEGFEDLSASSPKEDGFNLRATQADWELLTTQYNVPQAVIERLKGQFTEWDQSETHSYWKTTSPMKSPGSDSTTSTGTINTCTTVSSIRRPELRNLRDLVEKTLNTLGV